VKTCRACQVEKPLEDFSPWKQTKDGRYSYCRVCANAKSRAAKADPALRARNAARQRARRADPAIKARDRETSRAWKERNPERSAVLYNNPEKRAKDRERRRTPLGRQRTVVIAQRYHARRRNQEGGFTFDEWHTILARFNHRCAYCLAQADLQVEHMTPLSRGGRHETENIVPACRRCNQTKNSKNLLEFAAYTARRASMMNADVAP